MATSHRENSAVCWTSNIQSIVTYKLRSDQSRHCQLPTNTLGHEESVTLISSSLHTDHCGEEFEKGWIVAERRSSRWSLRSRSRAIVFGALLSFLRIRSIRRVEPELWFSAWPPGLELDDQPSPRTTGLQPTMSLSRSFRRIDLCHTKCDLAGFDLLSESI